MKLTDKSIMPFGKHLGKQMKDVPAEYLNWLWVDGGGQPMRAKDHRPNTVGQYISDNLPSLAKDAPDLIWDPSPKAKLGERRRRRSMAYREESIGGVSDGMGNVYSDADPGL